MYRGGFEHGKEGKVGREERIETDENDTNAMDLEKDGVQGTTKTNQHGEFSDEDDQKLQISRYGVCMPVK